jgi:hypothetical protein
LFPGFNQIALKTAAMPSMWMAEELRVMLSGQCSCLACRESVLTKHHIPERNWSRFASEENTAFDAVWLYPQSEAKLWISKLRTAAVERSLLEEGVNIVCLEEANAPQQDYNASSYFKFMIIMPETPVHVSSVLELFTPYFEWVEERLCKGDDVVLSGDPGAAGVAAAAYIMYKCYWDAHVAVKVVNSQALCIDMQRLQGSNRFGTLLLACECALDNALLAREVLADLPLYGQVRDVYLCD